MKVFYYTIDDMSLSRKGLLRKGWTIQHFDTLEEAIRSYREIPLSKDKRLGLTDSMHILELVRCVPLFPFDTAGEDILASDYRQYPLWADLPEAKSATQDCIKQFNLRYQFCSDAITPLPRSNRLSKHLRDKYLWRSINRDPDSAIRWIYIGGTGWVPLEEWKRHASSHPLVLKFRADGLTERGDYCYLEIEPWEYDLLVRRTLERLDQNTSTTGGRKK